VSEKKIKINVLSRQRTFLKREFLLNSTSFQLFKATRQKKNIQGYKTKKKENLSRYIHGSKKLVELAVLSGLPSKERKARASGF